ncbi:MAG: hypothetical protein AAGA32_20495 [Pseudomonadota bacterium]
MKLTTGLTAAAIALGTLPTTVPLPAEARSCGKRENIISRLGERYGEIQTGRGLSHNNGMVEVYSSKETGTWTILITMPSGETCLIAAGDFWEQSPPGVARSGQPT